MTMNQARPAYAIDGRTVTRESFYEAACDPRRSLVVEACAGAGKTWMLVSRMLRALLEGARPQEILAITFTKKAAGEMRQRLSDWLHEFALASEADRVKALVQRGLRPDEAQRQAPALAALYERVLAGGRPVEIRTFHGWFSQLLRQAPLELLTELGLQPEMDLVEDITELLPQVWRAFLADVAGEPGLRADYTALVLARGRFTTHKWLEAALDKRIELELADAAGTLEASVADPAVLWPECAGLPTPASLVRGQALANALWQFARVLGASGKATQTKIAQVLEMALGEPDDQAAFEGVWKALFTGNGTPRKLGDRPEQAALCDALQRIRTALDQHAAREEHLRLVRLSRVLLARYRDVKQARGLADMADLERCALALLRDATLAGWVQERLDARVRHLLIDEFQDTSPLQWHALHAWLAGYAGAGGGQGAPSVFIVGDPKQSIYRFRRAEPRVFEAAQHFVREALGGALLACDHTRRNAPAVIAALNPVFEQAAAEGLMPGFRSHTTESQAAGEVRALPGVPRPEKLAAARRLDWRDSLTQPRFEPEEALRMAEARHVARAVAELVGQGWAPGDIFVLSRKRAHLRVLGEALREQRLPHVAPEEHALMDAPEVRDLVALLDVLVSPHHDLSLAQVLKSPLFGASDEDLLDLAAQVQTALREGHASPRQWWQAVMQGRGESAALQRARELLPQWQQLAAQLPPHDLLERIVSQGQVRERYAAVVPPNARALALEQIDALVNQALLLDGARYATPYNFVRALKRRAVQVPPRAHPEAVQLLTVHGAKGLEARAVFVMDADPAPPQQESATLLVEWPVDSTHPACCAFVASMARCPPSLKPLLERERQAQAREELNGLYVAMTRAAELLVFSRTEPHRAAGSPSWWQRLAPVLPPEPWWPAAQGRGAGEDEQQQPAVLPVLPRLQRPPQPGQPPGPAARPSGRTDEAALLGRAVHRALEWLTARPVQQRDDAALSHAAAAAAAELGLPVGTSAAIKALVQPVLRSAEAAHLLDPARLAWAGNEVPMAWGGEVLRLDRLVALDTGAGRQWWVLDYKLQHAPQELAAYRDQLARYRAAVQAAQPGEDVRAAFITGAGRLVEVR
jgi:ATP-dependent helicase/nuclease subunit A